MKKIFTFVFDIVHPRPTPAGGALRANQFQQDRASLSWLTRYYGIGRE